MKPRKVLEAYYIVLWDSAETGRGVRLTLDRTKGRLAEILGRFRDALRKCDSMVFLRR